MLPQTPFALKGGIKRRISMAEGKGTGWGDGARWGMWLGKRRVTEEGRVEVAVDGMCPNHMLAQVYAHGTVHSYKCGSFLSILCNIGEHCIDISYYVNYYVDNENENNTVYVLFSCRYTD